mmetsp:Transcript_14400/g.43542  ORF Transcript_14400/g.43542 Transcript_14400/m.43542 type:complete len:97 (+) Transcript_14400:345-635(+)|eukprot:CAMPEP_0206142808 /NCGR_PEP_ID=MMETSP1473-20131121/18283_1 /ASSEMBLY_ACC=CAM_ASM_001109 /TAXON_ID=1461547 /ORGANISM="Stichococcus sp, Strain RCC1054" /LENGTH=96 /DNA_ID=CAMNT_0053537941 /DNA_START=296 /DNA_END=586 /DNA_ORIENTATION=-
MGDARSYEITKKAEESLIYKLKQHAMKKCESRAKAYAECAEGRTVSVVWACREHLNDLNACLKQCTGADTQQQLFRRFAEAGRPEKPDWDALLEGL